MREVNFSVLSNKKIAADIYKLALSGKPGELLPGSFVELKIPGFTLRRPFGVADSSASSLTLLYKAVGAGTKEMQKLQKGEILSGLVDLGNGFDLTASEKPLLIGGGIGAAPLYALAKKLKETGKSVSIILGARRADELFFVKEFEKTGTVYICTDDGSRGTKGNVLDTLKANNIDFDYYYACGPEVMLKALCRTGYSGEISLEARMGCGFGACMGCSVKCVGGPKRVCKEGPVFKASEVIFDD